MATTRANLLSLTMSAIALAGLLALPVAAQGEPPNLPPPDAAPSEQSQQDDREAEKAQAKAEKQQQREAEKAQAEAEKQQQREAEKAQAEAEKQQQREAEKAQAEAEKQQQREAEKAQAEAEKQQQREAEKAQAEAEKQQQREAEKAQAEAEKQQQREAEKAQAEAEKQQQREAEKAQAEAEKQQQREAEKAQAEGEKQQQREAEKAQAEAEKQQREAKDKAEAEKQKLDAAKAKQTPEPAPQTNPTQTRPPHPISPTRTWGSRNGRKPKRRRVKLRSSRAKQQRQNPKPRRSTGKSSNQAIRRPRLLSPRRTRARQTPTSRSSSKPTKRRLTQRRRPTPTRTVPKVERPRPVSNRPQPIALVGRTRDGARTPELRLDAKNETQAVEQLKQERVKADDEFEKAKREAEQKAPSGAAKATTQDRERRSEGAENEFVKVRKQRQERVEDGGRRAVIEEPDKRVIVIEKDRSFVRHDETRRFARTGTTPKRERRKDGTILSIYVGFGGVEILNLEDEEGRLLRRSRRGADGREIVLVDNRRFYSSRPRGRYYDAYVDLAPPVVRIPRDKYIVEYDEASEEDIYEALNAPPIERLQRGYALEEVRQSRWLRERMRRVDLNAINFAFASWEVDESQYSKLERVADAMRRILKRNPDEMFLIEGHTDAVGSEIDNLSLSDRRAESVAIILSDTFRVPPENLTTQGYGEQYLKVPTEGPSRANRRVAVRRITPLLSRSDDYSDRSPERVR